jgi:hypothetical protein
MVKFLVIKYDHNEVQDSIRENPKFSPFFDDCIGAIWPFNLHFQAGRKAPTMEKFSRLIKGLDIPVGKFYLGDAGYALKPYCLTPYHGTRYNLKECMKANKKSQTKEELFNLRHWSLIPQLKKRLELLKKGSLFSKLRALLVTTSVCKQSWLLHVLRCITSYE